MEDSYNGFMQTHSSLPLSRRATVVAATLDIVVILLFAWIGRSAHAEELTVLGTLQTAWPFLVGAAVGWALVRAWKRPWALVRTGLPVWATSLVVGMGLRALTGSGIALPFVIVATVSLLIGLAGWRGIAALTRRLDREPRAD